MAVLSCWRACITVLAYTASAARMDVGQPTGGDLSSLEPISPLPARRIQQELEHAHGSTGLGSRKSSRGAYFLTFSCLPVFKDGRRLCGSRNPMLMNEMDETDEEKQIRLEFFKHDLGYSYALETCKENLRFMKDNGVQAFISLEAGHVQECEVERRVLKQRSGGTLSDEETLFKARSCGDSAAGYQNQGNNTILSQTSSILGSGTRWGLVPIPDAAAVRIPYMHLWKFYADEFFNNFCEEAQDDCRIMTHCVGGNGRTGMMIMTYVLDQIRQQKVLDLPTPKAEWLDITLDLAGQTAHERFGQIRKIYYSDRFSELDLYLENECTQAFCVDSFADMIIAKALLPELDKDRAKLLARCRLACSICTDQVMSRPYKPGKEDTVYTLGNHMPAAVLQAMVMTIMVRGLKAGEFYHVTPRQRPPGQCMRLVQWWQCLADPEFQIFYAIPGWKPLLINCKDSTPFHPNEFGVYQNWAKSEDPKDEAAWGPEENPGQWQPTTHERHYQKRWKIAAGGAALSACPDDDQGTLECTIGEKVAQYEEGESHSGESGWETRQDAAAMAISIMPF